MASFGAVTTVDGTCGLGVVYHFSEDPTNDWGNDRVPMSDFDVVGTGFFVAGFIDTPICLDTYNVLIAKNELVYQSPVRVNENSGNEFFFCIFDSKKRFNMLLGCKPP